MVALIIAIVVALPAHAVHVAGDVSTAGASDVTTLRIGMMEPIDSLNPFLGINDNAYVFYGLVYDYLIAVDEDMQPKPNLASSWYIVPDELPYGSCWQYNLTRNAKWHDGEPFTAEDVVFTFEYQIGDNWLSMWAYQPYTVLVDHVEQVDEYTVRVYFADFESNPSPCSFGDSLMMPIVPEHIWRSIPPETAGFSYPNTHPIGTGPFMCTDMTDDEFQRGDRLILLRNPHYHLGPVKFDRLILQFYLEPAAMMNDIQRGAIDLAAMDVPNYANLVKWLEDNPTDEIQTFSGLKCTSFSVEIGISLKQESPGTNHLRFDKAVRLAMAHATDKEFIRDHIYMGYGELGTSLLSPLAGDLFWQPEPDEVIPYDLDMANAVLDAAGYVWNDDHTVRVAGPGNPYAPAGTELSFDMVVEEELFEDRATAVFLKEEWAKIGIQITPRYVSSALWNTIVYGGVYDTMLTYWSGDPDPNYLLYTQSSFALDGWSENWYSSAEYDENYTGSLLAVDPEIRKQYILNCQEHIYKDCAFIVYLYPYGCYAWREDHFTGWGDWGAHPGRGLSNYWTANDLFFDLEPVTTNEEPFAILDNVAGIVGTEVTITGFASDPEGSNLTYTIESGDGANLSGVSPPTAEFYFTHTYSASGTYLINLTVSDGTEGVRISSLATIVEEGENVPPSNLRVMPSTLKGVIGEQTVFVLTGRDHEGDPVSLSLSFGDNSDPYSVTATDTSEGFQIVVNHTFAQTGLYQVSMLANDTHSEILTVLYYPVLEAEAGGGGGMDALTLIGFVAIVLVAVVIVVVVLRRKGGRREEEDVRLP